MSAQPHTVEFGTSLQEAWGVMRRERIKALPVTDRAQHIIGIITLADFMRRAEADRHGELGQRLREFLRPSGLVQTTKPEVVGQIMSRQMGVVSGNRPLTERMPLFTDGGQHHIPVTGDDNKVIGMITQSDVVRAVPGG